MPWPRHVMQSLEIQSVTQARVSDDYTPGNQQWKIGDTTILATALGLASFKDVSHILTLDDMLLYLACVYVIYPSQLSCLVVQLV